MPRNLEVVENKLWKAVAPGSKPLQFQLWSNPTLRQGAVEVLADKLVPYRPLAILAASSEATKLAEFLAQEMQIVYIATSTKTDEKNRLKAQFNSKGERKTAATNFIARMAVLELKHDGIEPMMAITELPEIRGKIVVGAALWRQDDASRPNGLPFSVESIIEGSSSPGIEL